MKNPEVSTKVWTEERKEKHRQRLIEFNKTPEMRERARLMMIELNKNTWTEERRRKVPENTRKGWVTRRKKYGPTGRGTINA